MREQKKEVKYMPVIDDIKESQSKLKGKGFKYKFQYFWEYYRVPTAITLFAIIFIGSIIKTAVTAKDSAFEAIMINAVGTPSEEAFAEELEIDTKKYEVNFDSSYMMTGLDSFDQTTYASMQKLVAVVASGSADVVLTPPEYGEHYAKSDMMLDLREVFDESFLESLGDKVIWLKQIDSDTGEPVGEEAPYLIDVSDAKGLRNEENLCYATDTVYFGVWVNAKHADSAKKFYDFINE